MDRWKAEMGRVREEKRRRKKITKESVWEERKIQAREKVGKSRNTVFLQWFVSPEGRRVGSLKRRVRSQLARWEMKNCTPLWRKAHFEVKMYKAHLTSFGNWDAKKCTPLWRKAHFEVKMLKAPGFGPFGRSDVVSRGRRKGLWTWPKVNKTWAFSCIFNYNHHYTTLQLQLYLYYTTFHYTKLHSTTLHYTTLHSITINHTQLHYTTLHYTTLHTTLHYATLHSTTPHYITVHSTTLHHTTTTLHYIPLHYPPLHSTTLCYITLY